MVYTKNFSSNGRPYTAVTFEFASLLTMVKNGDPRVNHLQKHHLKGQKRLVSYVGDNANPKSIRSLAEAEGQIRDKVKKAATAAGLDEDAFLITRKKPYTHTKHKGERKQTVRPNSSPLKKLTAIKNQLAAMGYGSMAFQERTLSTLTSFITAAAILSCPSQLSTGQYSFSGWSV